LFFSMSALAGDFVVHRGAADKIGRQDDWRKRGPRGWESGVVAWGVTNTLDRLARHTLARTDGKGPFFGPSTGAARSGKETRVSAT